MSYQKEYKEKLTTAQKAAKLVKSGNVVDYGFFNGKPGVCDLALTERADELENVSIFSAVTLPPIPMVVTKPDAFTYNDLQFSKLTRMLKEHHKNIFYGPVLYHLIPPLVENGLGPDRDVGFIRSAPWINMAGLIWALRIPRHGLRCRSTKKWWWRLIKVCRSA